jgi:phospholipid-translocating ATPase
MKRHRTDDETNNRLAKVTSWQTGAAVTSEAVRWRDIRVGDLLYVSNKQPLPADMVILASSEAENICYIETSSIDGETNLKLRRGIGYLPIEAPPLANPVEIVARLESDQATIRAELPNMKIESFSGTFNIPQHAAHTAPDESAPQGDEFNKVIPIDNENVLLRGAVLRNTAWAVGAVVYTGKDTKLQVCREGHQS